MNKLFFVVSMLMLSLVACREDRAVTGADADVVLQDVNVAETDVTVPTQTDMPADVTQTVLDKMVETPLQDGVQSTTR